MFYRFAEVRHVCVDISNIISKELTKKTNRQHLLKTILNGLRVIFEWKLVKCLVGQQLIVARSVILLLHGFGLHGFVYDMYYYYYYYNTTWRYCNVA